MMTAADAMRISGTGELPPTLVDDWRAFLRDVDPQLPPAMTGYDVLFDHPTLFPLQRLNELSEMMMLAQEVSPKVALVIGSDKGVDAYHFIRCLPTLTKLIAIEIRGTPYIPLFQEHFQNVQMLGVAESSYDPETVAKVKAFIGDDRIDVAFLDGQKTEYLRDFDSYLPMMRKGGLMFLHDIVECHGNDPTVQAWREIKKRGYATSEIIDFSEGVQEMRRLPAPPLTAHAGWLRIFHNRSCGVGVVKV